MSKLVPLFYFYFLSPLLMFVMKRLAKKDSKIQLGLELRQKQNNRWPWLTSQPLTRPLVIHCASGEFEYAKSLIRELRKTHSSTALPIHVSYFSPTYRKQVQSFEGVDFSYPSPWEKLETLHEYFDYHKPRAILFARTDIWPGFAHVAKLKNTPTFLFSATLSSNSSKLNSLMAKRLALWTLSGLRRVFCVSEEDNFNFVKLGLSPDRVQTLGDTRYDQAIWRIHNPRSIKVFQPRNREQTIVCGSTWKEDEEVLVEVIRQLKNEWQFVIAPHEPSHDHLSDLKNLFEKNGIQYQLYSEEKDFQSDVLIIDRVGILADLYSLANWAFVGGSFKKTVHSVMEPLAHGACTLVGPYFSNNREAILFQQMPYEPVRMANDANEMIKKLKMQKLSQSEIKTLVQQQSGATAKLIDLIKDHLE